MSNSANNPLFKHFRQPAIYIKLPSNGQFYPDNGIDLPITGEIPVYPMTVKDELTLKTPDALMNGSGIVDVIKSCCPNIRDPWSIPSIDLDTIFIAVRLASYGPGMEISSICPHCKNKNEHLIDLRAVLDKIRQVDYSQPVEIDGLTFRFKPHPYKNINQNNIISFEEQRLINSVIQNDELSDEEKNRQFNESFNKLKEMNIHVVADNIRSIVTPEGVTVTDSAQISEFLEHVSRITYEQIKSAITRLNDQIKLAGMSLTCDECTKSYESNLEFDQANFFG
jgi:hypothetical protein